MKIKSLQTSTNQSAMKAFTGEVKEDSIAIQIFGIKFSVWMTALMTNKKKSWIKTEHAYASL